MKYRSNTRQRKKSIQGLRSFKDTLPRKIREAFLKKGKIYSKITDNWKIIVGSELYNACKPKSFSVSLLTEYCPFPPSIKTKSGKDIVVLSSLSTLENLLFNTSFIMP